MNINIYIELILGFLVVFFLITTLLTRNDNNNLYHENETLNAEKYALEIELGKFRTIAENKSDSVYKGW